MSGIKFVKIKKISTNDETEINREKNSTKENHTGLYAENGSGMSFQNESDLYYDLSLEEKEQIEKLIKMRKLKKDLN